MKTIQNLILTLFLMSALLLLAGCALEGSLPAIAATAAAPAAATETALGGERVTVKFATALYDGPGHEFQPLGSTFPGNTHRAVGQDPSGEWYQLDDDSWVTAFALENRPELPIVNAPTARILAEVVEILDGDSIIVEYNERERPVGYLISSAPQLAQPYGEEAFEANQDLLSPGQTVLLERDQSELDPYGQELFYVFREEDEVMVNEEMIRQGYAQVAIFPPDTRYEERLREAQDEARAGNRGLWAADVVPYREEDGRCFYRIQAGDLLFVIAQRFGVLMDDLVLLNGLESPDMVRLDSDLLIPGCGQDPPPMPTPTPTGRPASTPVPDTPTPGTPTS